MFLVHWGDVIEPIEIRNCLQIGLVLDQLLSTAMQEPDVRIHAFHYLAVELEHQTQYAVRRGVLRSEIDGKVAQLGFSRSSDRCIAQRQSLFASRYSPALPSPAFSSPGSG